MTTLHLLWFAVLFLILYGVFVVLPVYGLSTLWNSIRHGRWTLDTPNGPVAFATNGGELPDAPEAGPKQPLSAESAALCAEATARFEAARRHVDLGRMLHWNFIPRTPPPPGAPPFGYRREGFELVPAPEEQVVIARIRSLWAERRRQQPIAETLVAEGHTGRYGALDDDMIRDIAFFGRCVEAPFGQRRSETGDLEINDLEQEAIVIIEEMLDAGAPIPETVINGLLYQGYLYRGSTTWPVSCVMWLMNY